MTTFLSLILLASVSTTECRIQTPGELVPPARAELHLQILQSGRNVASTRD